jgi:hypothetical protein
MKEGRYRLHAMDTYSAVTWTVVHAEEWPAFLSHVREYMATHERRMDTWLSAIDDQRCCCCSNGLSEDQRDELSELID